MNHRDERTREYRDPSRLLWQAGGVQNGEALLRGGSGQATIWASPGAFLPPGASVLLDYGVELHGGIQLIAGRSAKTFSEERVLRVRVRFGESVSEAMGFPDNDHAVHDATVGLAAMGATEFGNTGFRFVRLDNLESDRILELREVRAVFLHRPMEALGAFECDDPLVNEIWRTGAYTTELCLQDYLWDGIKRDRLVWMGDMHPEIMVAASVFGKPGGVERSLDLVRDETPLPRYMNGFPAYSLWWIISQGDWYRFHGDLEYLGRQRAYLAGLLDHFLAKIETIGTHDVDGLGRIIDWAYVGKEDAIKGGFHALLVLSLEAGAMLCAALEDETRARACLAAARSLRTSGTLRSAAKSVLALQALAGILDPVEANRAGLAVEPLRGLSTYPGFYVLQARALAGDHGGAMDLIRAYWGGMLSLGATSFWEHFDLAWMEGAGRIDEMPRDGLIDLHRQYGEGCFKGWRHSLCHGWASGPTAWLSEQILGVRVVSPGARRVILCPHLPGLSRVRGRFPTPLGTLHVECEKRPDGSLKTRFEAPEGMAVEIRADLAARK
ncbi:MAG: alpha-L-rhamnosidase [Spirochaetes bacterium]|nr:alpha-L-rhamnosidase [Spirochaetota bacterium]